MINLKFGITVNSDEQIMKQLEEGIYTRNAKSPEEEAYLRNKITYIYRSKHNIEVKRMNIMPKLLRD